VFSLEFAGASPRADAGEHPDPAPLSTGVSLDATIMLLAGLVLDGKRIAAPETDVDAAQSEKAIEAVESAGPKTM